MKFRNTSVPKEIKFLLPLHPSKLYFFQVEGVGMVLKLVVNIFKSVYFNSARPTF
jgi:hypothetical protein